MQMIAGFVAILLSIAAAPAIAQAPEYDLLIVGGQVVDGTGAQRYRADVAIKGDRIALISRERIAPASAKQVLAAEGLIVSPGFIDNHAHIATNIHEYPLAENFIRQGITSILASLHSGDQPYPLKPYMDALRVAPNVGFFAGHSFARSRVMGTADRAPTAAELKQMEEIVDRSMRDGALGLSSGLVYVPAAYAKTDELVALARVAARHGGIYVSHIRDEGRGVVEAVAEVIQIAEQARIPGQVNHHKAMGAAQWGWSSRTLKLIRDARARGLDISHDVYPYAASSSKSDVMFPAWALAGGRDAFAARVRDPAQRSRIEREMRDILLLQRTGTDLKRLQFRSIAAMPEYDGKTLEDLLSARGLSLTPEAAIDLLIELQEKGGFTAIYHVMDERDIVAILRDPLAMIETDGDPVGFGEGFPHPRSYGAFPRVLGKYVREQKVLTLEDAIRRMTSLPAERIGQRERGRIQEGAFADIAVFDADTIIDRATYTDPHNYPVGIVHVVVNGTPVLRNGSLTAALPGRTLYGRRAGGKSLQ